MITRRSLLAMLPLGALSKYLKRDGIPEIYVQVQGFKHRGTVSGRFSRSAGDGLNLEQIPRHASREELKARLFAYHYGMSAERFRELMK